MAHAPEPPFTHDRTPRIGILLINLGTPEAATAGAVRRYLAQFLSDPRVVEIAPWAWKPALHGVVLNVRPRKSAARYKSIWTKDGSPLLVHSLRQRTLLLGYLGQRLKRAGFPADLCPVEIGMRYGNPSIGTALDKLRSGHCEKILVLPLYPQYAASTTGAAFDAVASYLARARRLPGLRFVETFHSDEGYIQALAQNVNDYWTKHGRPDKLVVSFHGVPRRTLERGDPYHCYCHATGRLLARELGLAPAQWTLAFQSRFGRAQWLTPYTSEVLGALGRDGVARVDVVCPGFVTDCLETLEEIAIAGAATFKGAGGTELNVIPCLNEHPRWITALADICFRNLAGWLAQPPDADARELTQVRAKAIGAQR
jgi:ferrochelatase